MRKHIWIIGNDDPACGVSVDIDNYCDYFKSARGGCWNDEEITISRDISTAECMRGIAYFKRQNFDFFILVFSGHGGIVRGTDDTTMILTRDGRNTITESEFDGISSRQLNILDCCRDYYTPTAMIKASRAIMLLNSATLGDRNSIRTIYDRKIAQSAVSDYRMYACSAGERARGSSGSGGVFTSVLLAISKSMNLNGRDATLNDIFVPVRDEVKRIGRHTPEFVLPRCVPSKNLVWINYPFV